MVELSELLRFCKKLKRITKIKMGIIVLLSKVLQQTEDQKVDIVEVATDPSKK